MCKPDKIVVLALCCCLTNKSHNQWSLKNIAFKTAPKLTFLERFTNILAYASSKFYGFDSITAAEVKYGYP
ncbi:hypothetical protein L596_000175 [Steinernema carpocapsae]|uniref:Uncharacterized protein n=1 Tax=Steinernema carpocapsae TaxID=34508 RepID=A0A4U8UIF4_STECR|nr:hypothetical protein L596_000175 [Steinernema carpocapsae]